MKDYIKKVWVYSIFTTMKGLLLSVKGKRAKVELVGWRFGCHPNGKIITCPVSRLMDREE